jgi:CDGSH-type Zn-finger protein/uncharacterized Fe-S cluster protein YjdI
MDDAGDEKKPRIKEFAGRDVVIRYDAARCIHAAECVHGAPEVFDPTARPWIDPDRGDAEHLAEVVRRCPTGALTLTFADGRVAESPASTTTASLVVDGPIYLRGKVVYAGGTHASLAEYTRVALCRCGASANKPFCDGSHAKVGFKDAGACKSTPPATATQASGPVTLNPIRNGPLMVEGWVEFHAADGSTFIAGDKCWLCRCGNSASKPFCDGTHKRIGFIG